MKPRLRKIVLTLAAILQKPVTGSIFAILAAMLVGAVILAVVGHNPLQVYGGLIYGAVGRPRFLVNTIIRATPLILTGLSVTFAYKSGLFNIGVEGQFIVGSVAAVFLGHFLPTPPVLPSVLHPLVMMAGAMLAAGAFGALVGLLKARFNIHEVLSSIMLNWVALNLLNLYIGIERFQRNPSQAHPIQDSASLIFFQELRRTPEGIAQLQENEFLWETFFRPGANSGIFIAIAAVILVKFILDKTNLGYTLKAVGANRDAAEFAGINVKKYTVLSMFFAGGLAGLAAAIQVAGTSPGTINVLTGFQNHGFNGIPVALLANAAVIPNIFSALLFGGMDFGSAYIQSRHGIATEIIDVMVGLIVFFVALRAVCVRLGEKLRRSQKSEGGGAHD